MGARYTCIKAFKLSIGIGNKEFEVEKNSSWYCEEELDAEGVTTTDVYLVSYSGECIEITRECFNKHFEKMIESVRRTSMSENTIDPFFREFREKEIIIVDSKNDLRKEDFEAQGYEIQVLDLSKEELQNTWNPYEALAQLAEEDPDRFKTVVEELEKTIENG